MECVLRYFNIRLQKSCSAPVSSCIDGGQRFPGSLLWNPGVREGETNFSPSCLTLCRDSAESYLTQWYTIFWPSWLAWLRFHVGYPAQNLLFAARRRAGMNAAVKKSNSCLRGHAKNWKVHKNMAGSTSLFQKHRGCFEWWAPPNDRNQGTMHTMTRWKRCSEHLNWQSSDSPWKIFFKCGNFSLKCHIFFNVAASVGVNFVHNLGELKEQCGEEPVVLLWWLLVFYRN